MRTAQVRAPRTHIEAMAEWDAAMLELRNRRQKPTPKNPTFDKAFNKDTWKDVALDVRPNRGEVFVWPRHEVAPTWICITLNGHIKNLKSNQTPRAYYTLEEIETPEFQEEVAKEVAKDLIREWLLETYNDVEFPESDDVPTEQILRELDLKDEYSELLLSILEDLHRERESLRKFYDNRDMAEKYENALYYRTVRITDQDRDLFMKLGNGSIDAGLKAIAEAVRHYQEES